MGVFLYAHDIDVGNDKHDYEVKKLVKQHIAKAKAWQDKYGDDPRIVPSEVYTKDPMMAAFFEKYNIQYVFPPDIPLPPLYGVNAGGFGSVWYTARPTIENDKTHVNAYFEEGGEIFHAIGPSVISLKHEGKIHLRNKAKMKSIYLKTT